MLDALVTALHATQERPQALERECCTTLDSPHRGRYTRAGAPGCLGHAVAPIAGPQKRRRCPPLLWLLVPRSGRHHPPVRSTLFDLKIHLVPQEPRSVSRRDQLEPGLPAGDIAITRGDRPRISERSISVSAGPGTIERMLTWRSDSQFPAQLSLGFPVYSQTSRAVMPHEHWMTRE
jgi:hypothetical protein